MKSQSHPKAETTTENILIKELKGRVHELEDSYTRVVGENQLLSKRLHETKLLYKIAAMLNSTYDMGKLNNIIQVMLSEITLVSEYALVNKTIEGMHVAFCSDSAKKSGFLNIVNDAAEKVIKQSKEYFIPVLNQKTEWVPLMKHKAEGSFLALPLSSHKKTQRALCIYATHELAENERQFIHLIANEIGVAIERTIVYQETFEISVKDGLTGIFNRRYFNDRSHREFSRAKRHKRILSFIMMDIDNFKKFNDTYGHKVGDEVLMWVAKNLGLGLRDSDVLARYGGEEFIIMLPETDVEGAAFVAEKIRAHVEEGSKKLAHLFSVENPHSEFRAKNITLSIGVSSFPAHGALLPEVIEKADQQLYVAKSKGRNIVCFDL